MLLRQDSAEGEVTLSQDQGHSLILIVLSALEVSVIAGFALLLFIVVVYQKKDYRLALQLSTRLMQIQFSPAWEICR